MTPEKENIEDIENFELLIPAKKLFDKMIESTDGYTPKEMTDDEMKKMKLLLGYMNAYRGAFGNKLQYFKLIGVANKNEVVKQHMGKK